MILVTGGLGYIGSHTVVELLRENEELIIIDNLSNSDIEVLDAIEIISGRMPIFIEGDIRDEALLKHVFNQYHIESVIHFAGLKAVGESKEYPLSYYDHNVCASVTLFKMMAMYHCKNIIFSSSATVYGQNNDLPFKEDANLSTNNPYGATKKIIEEILSDLYDSDKSWAIGILRYFNPIGAHKSGLIGENPKGIPNNLLPFIGQVASGQLKELKVYGNDYDTIDGTGVRDYIHVLDLARGHLKALGFIRMKTCFETFNLGTGQGHSVLQVLSTFEDISGCKIPYEITNRRPGDVATSYACVDKAGDQLGWTAQYTLEEMCQDLWHYIKKQGQ